MCMTATRPKVEPEARLNMTQTARVLGVHRDTIRRWTNLGYLKPRYFKHTLRPRYLGKDILKFWEQDI